jgi:hypothetical protein
MDQYARFVVVLRTTAMISCLCLSATRLLICLLSLPTLFAFCVLGSREYGRVDTAHAAKL